jgi:O-antigen/teichoic acid export membrane protein
MSLVNAIGFMLRGGSAAAKFLFVLYLAGKTSSELLGQVAILIAVAAIFTQIAGLEVNQVVGRQLHALSGDERIQLFRRHALAAITAYFVLTPVALAFYSDLLIPNWTGVVCILVLEHLITEVYRYNILMLRPTYASALFFIKNAGWILVFVLLAETGIAAPSFALVVQCWAGILVLTGTPLILSRHVWPTLRTFVRPSAWLPQTASLVWQARLFVVSSIALAGVGSIDKLLIGERFSTAELGVYFFFSTCTSVISLLVSFSIGATAGPRCIKIFATEGRVAYLPQYRRLQKLYWLTTFDAVLAITLPAGSLLAFFDKLVYLQHLEILYLLTPAAALVVLCEPYKMTAYLERRDLELVLGNVFHLISVVACVTLFSQQDDFVWVAVGMLLSSMLTYAFFALNVGGWVVSRWRLTPA